jgi:putative ATP-grasp target RiPP
MLCTDLHGRSLRRTEEAASTFPLPDNKDPDSEHALPWGLTRMTPLPPASPFLYASIHLDPVSQQAVYVGPGGEPIKAGKHGTNKATKKKEKTGGGDGKDPQPADQTEVQDYDDD